MESGKKQVYPKVGKNHRHKTQYGNDSDFFPFPAPYKTAMQIKSIEEPGY